MGKYQPFNDLPASQFQALVADVARHGVLLPIIVDEDDVTIDGHQRRRAAAEASVDCPRIVVAGLTDDEKQEMAITLNLFRRHLAGVERSQALQKLANLGLSTRRISSALGIAKSTVHDGLRQLSESGQLDRPERVEGADGKSRPATMPKRPADSPTGEINIDPATGEILDSTLVEPPLAKVAPLAEVEEAVDRTDVGYRATTSRFHAATRTGLLTLDPQRIAEVTDHDDWPAMRAFASDLLDWAGSLAAALDSSTQLRRVK
jgi:ParB family chromosome partitioning protein